MTAFYEVESAMRAKFPELDANERTALLIKYVQEVCGRQSSFKYPEDDGVKWVVELTLAPEIAKTASLDDEKIHRMLLDALPGAEDYEIGVRVLDSPAASDLAHAE